MKKGKQDSLEEILKEIWSMLKRGADSYRDPFHCPVLGTTGEKGCNLRTVILRQVRVQGRTLVCYTDARAPKVQEIEKDNRVSWLFYHPKKEVQLRIAGQALLHADDSFADEHWDATRITSRLNYCAVDPPGTLIDGPSSGLPDLLLNKVPTLLSTERGRKNFMAIECRIESIDWLVLSLLGNKRAKFEWDEQGSRAEWVIP